MELFIVIICFGLLVGYAMNIVKLTKSISTFTGLDAVRIAGMFIPPVGGVLGFISIKNKKDLDNE